MGARMRERGSRTVAGGALAALLWASLPASGFPAPATGGDPGSLPPLLDRLARRALLYEKAALGFSCEETVILGKFEAKSGESKREERTLYNYLYEGNPQSGYQEIRMLVEKNGSPKESRLTDPDLHAPHAYDWALLFTDRHRAHFRFEPAGEELVGFHVARILGFSGSAPFLKGREIEEWSGRVWVDGETGNFVKVEAAPNQQDERLPLQRDQWLRSFRLGAIPIKRQPRGYHYKLSFTVEKLGLTFPGEAETRLFVLTPEGEEEIRERIAQRFRKYVFFNVQSQEEFLRTETPR